MKRLGIFVFYDDAGVVDRYVERLLEGILLELEKLVIIVNGNITQESKIKLEKYSNIIFQRENVGYDGGAYREFFLKYLMNEDWNTWDEIVMFNDTFFGPVVPFSKIFENMQKYKIDFWGLSKFNGGRLQGNEIPVHIQGYFLVCKKRLIKSEAFLRFWKTMDIPKSYYEAIWNFEIRFSVYFEQEGFLGKAYTEILGQKINAVYGQNTYIVKAYHLLKDLKFPIVKKKALTITNFEEAKKVLNYLRRETDYDIELIYEHLRRLAVEGKMKPFNPLQIEEFCNTHEGVYIYGYGQFGRNMVNYFEYKGWKYKGILVTKKDYVSNKVIAYKDTKIQEDEGNILALGKTALEEVYSVLKKELKETQIVLPLN